MPIYQIEIFDEYKTKGIHIILDTDGPGYSAENIKPVMEAAFARISALELDY